MNKQIQTIPSEKHLSTSYLTAGDAAMKWGAIVIATGAAAMVVRHAIDKGYGLHFKGPKFECSLEPPTR